MKNLLTGASPFNEANIAFFPMQPTTSAQTGILSIPADIAEKFDACRGNDCIVRGVPVKFLAITFLQEVSQKFIDDFWGQLTRHQKKSDLLYCVVAPHYICYALIKDNLARQDIMRYYYHDSEAFPGLEKDLFRFTVGLGPDYAYTLEKVAA